MPESHPIARLRHMAGVVRHDLLPRLLKCAPALIYFAEMFNRSVWKSAGVRFLVDARV